MVKKNSDTCGTIVAIISNGAWDNCEDVAQGQCKRSDLSES